ncbi:MAG: dephospho-CoA kinase [Solirubrobacterales bacterium]
MTGAIGAGKSEALAALGRLGAETLSSDTVVRQLLATDELRDHLLERWGERVAPGGTVDRSAVAEIVFEDPGERKWLESQLHPRVAQRMIDWRAAIDPATEVAVVEVPLLFENGLEEGFDAVIVVVAGDELRRARVAERGDAAVEGREQAQLSQEEKARRARYVVDNEGSLADLERELATVVEQIKR